MKEYYRNWINAKEEKGYREKEEIMGHSQQAIEMLKLKILKWENIEKEEEKQWRQQLPGSLVPSERKS